MDKDWTDRLRIRMQDYEAPEPDGLWERVLSSMDTVHGVQQRKRRAARTVLISVASLSVAAVLCALLLMPYQSADDFAAVPGTRVLVADSDGPVIEPDPLPRPAPVFLEPARHQVSDAAVSDAGDTQTGQQEEDASARETVCDPGSPENDNNENMKRYIPEDDRRVEPFISTSDRRRKRIISTGLYYANMPGSVRNASGYASLLSSPSYLRQEQVDGLVSSYDAGEVTFYRGVEEVRTETRYRPPLRVGISLRYDFGRRWNISTGLVYTMLSSETETGTSSRSYVTGRQLHYIGVPLRAGFDFLQRDRWSLYATAGGMVEKCVSGRSVTDYVVNGKVLQSSAVKDGIRELQWSAGASLGVEFDFVTQVGIYLEPGVEYFFDNGSGHGTIYNDRPLNFSLELGLRFNLFTE